MTVLGPIAADQLGFTLVHEHLLVSAAGLLHSHPHLHGPDPEGEAIAALQHAKDAGIDSIIDCTTFDLGRVPELLVRASEATGVHIVNTTGWWLDVPRFLSGVSANQMAEEFIRDAEEGFRGTNIRAGLLKCAADFQGVTPDLEVMARAVARAHKATGLPVMVHSYPTGQVARRQLEILGEEGVDLRRVKVDHCNDTTDVEYLTWILDQGCFIGLDRYPGRLVSAAARTRTMKELIDAGYADRLCPSHDCICVTVYKERPDGTMPEHHGYFDHNPDQMLFIHRHVLPELREMGVDDDVISQLFIDNPRRFLAGV